MMGFLICTCGRVILPSRSQGKMQTPRGFLDDKDIIPAKTETIEVEGEDKGWT